MRPDVLYYCSKCGAELGPLPEPVGLLRCAACCTEPRLDAIYTVDALHAAVRDAEAAINARLTGSLRARLILDLTTEPRP